MKATILRLIVIAAVFFVPLSAHGRTPVPIVDFLGTQIVTSSGKPPTEYQIRDAITSAAQSRNWQISHPVAGNIMHATLVVRGKHTVVVEITYSEQTFSIKYRNSSNMKYSYEAGSSVPVIHPYYNRWVTNLHDGIRMELNRI